MTYLRSTLFVLAPLGLLLAGCDSKVPREDNSSGAKTALNEKPASNNDAKVDPDATKDLPRSSLPNSLMSDAYRYYGLSNSKPVDMTIKLSSTSDVLTGSLNHRLLKVEGDVATFAEDSTGGIHDSNGNTTVELRKDGVYEVASDKTPIEKPFLDLPSDISKGKKWKVDTVIQVNGQEDHLKVDCESEGVTNLTTAGKSYPALLIVEKGTVGPANIVSKYWFIKDIGLVKNEMTATTKGGKPTNYLIEWQPNTKG